MMKLNMNDIVKVKLTSYGVDVFYHQFDEVNKHIKSCGGKPLEPLMPRIDKDGFTEFQLWYFIELYGAHIGMCKKNVVSDISIYIDDKDLINVCDSGK